jgi:tight adherence protein B
MFSAEVIRFLILLATFASVVLLTQVILRLTVERRAHAGAVNKRLKMIAAGAEREVVRDILRRNDPLPLGEARDPWTKLYFAFRRNLMMAAVPWTPSQVAIAMTALFAALVLIVAIGARGANYALTSGVILLILVFAAAAAIGVPFMVISFLAQRRRKRMQQQFPVALDVFVRSLRAGHPVAGALDLLTQEMEDPIGSEFGLVSDEIAYGANMADALNEMAERWDLDDIRMFVVSLSVQSETGGNLAEVLNNLSKVIRERAGLFLKVRALASEGRMTGWMLTALPIFTFVSVFLMNPGFYLDVAGDPIFFIGFPLMLLWYLIGVIAIRRMVNIKV